MYNGLGTKRLFTDQSYWSSC